ncbi:DNA glycosylase [Serendipita vermifera]|nr:DNA glycosylase [Serendipita vermifera]
MPPRTRNISNAARTVEKPSKLSNASKRGVKRKVAEDATESSDTGSDFASSMTPKKQRPTKRTRSTLEDNKIELNGENDGKMIVDTPSAPRVDWTVERPTYLPAVPSFSYEDAKAHLIRADPRFEGIFQRLPCRPFVQLERVEPFRTLATSIIGQQISWKAARSVNWKFMRLYDSSLPETVPPPETYKAPERFPPPHSVAETDLATLRSAGLSARKAEYIKDLAQHFTDGRLGPDQILSASDDDLYKSLISVRGIGPWTIDMFAIFSLRRPNILPVGDLGVQRGLLRWIVSQHSSPASPVKLSKKSLAQASNDSKEDDTSSQLMDASENVTAATGAMGPPETPKKKSKRGNRDNEAPIPPPFTPSIDRVLKAPMVPTPLPPGLTLSELRARLNGKKKVKGALLTPEEMDALTESWKPYRSLGVWYMWALTDQDVDEDD